QCTYKEEATMIEPSAQPTRRWSTWVIPLLAVVALVGIALWLWRSTTTPQTHTTPAVALSDGATQTNEGGYVTIAATWQGRSAGPIFSVAMNTHAIDLDGYDLTHLAVLRIDGGREVQPTSWEAPKGGHHRTGTLTFPTTAADGTPLIAPSTRTIEL